MYISRNPEIVRPPIPPTEIYESEEEIIASTTSENIVDPKDPNYNPEISEQPRVRNIHKICQHKN